jgi:hypothetical protein
MELVPSTAVRGHLAREIELGRLGATRLRLRVFLLEGRLTRRLAGGEDSVESRELALRARQLTAPRMRASIASSFEDVVARARRTPPLLTSQVPVHRKKVQAASRQIEELAARLRSPEPVRAQGVALALLLLTDPARPLHSGAGADELTAAIIHLNERLDAPESEGVW